VGAHRSIKSRPMVVIEPILLRLEIHGRACTSPAHFFCLSV
jgi:hypothetical protein